MASKIPLTFASSLVALRFIMSICLMITTIYANPIQTTQAQNYSSHFASFINPATGELLNRNISSKRITDFQDFTGLNVTGELDGDTMDLMSQSRYSDRDKMDFGTNSRSKRYVLRGSKWSMKALSYRISKYPKLLSHNEVDETTAKAFSLWADYTDLTFTAKQTGVVNIDISFVVGEHGDGYPFDGPRGTLAHTYSPVQGGEVHFDDTEYWTIRSEDGVDLFKVAAHEFGHALGLSHSEEKSALMYKHYGEYPDRLHSDDIKGIQKIYGKKSTKEICTNSTIDTIFKTPDGSTYVFKGSHYYKISHTGIVNGYPKLISEGWPGLPNNIDAAFTLKKGKTYFFRGTEYWRYSGRDLDGDFPQKISVGFPGIPDHLDAAFLWGIDGKIYIYKGTKLWKLNLERLYQVEAVIEFHWYWKGIDAALNTGGYTYLFKGDQFYRFNELVPLWGNPPTPLPQPTNSSIFGCVNDNQVYPIYWFPAYIRIYVNY